MPNKKRIEPFNESDIQKIFNTLNKDHSYDQLSELEVFVGLSKLNIPRETILQIFRKLDRNQSGFVSYQELSTFIQNQENRLREMFKMIDLDQDGKITSEELKMSLKEFYPESNYSSEIVESLLKQMDRNHDGCVDFVEWREFLLFMPETNLEYLMEWGGETSALLFNNMGDSPPIQMITENAKGSDKTSGVVKWLRNFFAGGIAGAVSRTLTAPLERLKILYQVNYKGASNPPNIIKGLKEIVHKDGFKGLFRGNFINVSKAIPDTSIKFATFELFKQLLKNGDDEKVLQSHELFIAGAGSGLVAGFCVFPLDVLKTRFAAAPTGTYSSIIDAVKKITKTEGKIKPFFNGFQATLLAALPNSGINLMTYDFFKNRTHNYYLRKNKEVPVSLFMVLGAFSAVIASSIMYPFQLVTSRIIMQGMSEQKNTMIGIINEVRNKEGVRGFYKGFGPAMSKILLGNGISFGSYEIVKKYLGKKT